mmetsp:Transcript_16133/g.49889  ORF Transcript_16133/g.49889 Transcript_16133/m.49889 type:complete len:258 (-) Transcript_16133:37-810(-)
MASRSRGAARVRRARRRRRGAPRVRPLGGAADGLGPDRVRIRHARQPLRPGRVQARVPRRGGRARVRAERETRLALVGLLRDVWRASPRRVVARRRVCGRVRRLRLPAGVRRLAAGRHEAPARGRGVLRAKAETAGRGGVDAVWRGRRGAARGPLGKVVRADAAVRGGVRRSPLVLHQLRLGRDADVARGRMGRLARRGGPGPHGTVGSRGPKGAAARGDGAGAIFGAGFAGAGRGGARVGVAAVRAVRSASGAART